MAELTGLWRRVEEMMDDSPSYADTLAALQGEGWTLLPPFPGRRLDARAYAWRAGRTDWRERPTDIYSGTEAGPWRLIIECRTAEQAAWIVAARDALVERQLAMAYMTASEAAQGFRATLIDAMGLDPATTEGMTDTDVQALATSAIRHAREAGPMLREGHTVTVADPASGGPEVNYGPLPGGGFWAGFCSNPKCSVLGCPGDCER